MNIVNNDTDRLIMILLVVFILNKIKIQYTSCLIFENKNCYTIVSLCFLWLYIFIFLYFYIFDNSALDTESEKIVQEALDKVCYGE